MTLIVGIDTETTGLEPGEHRIIEVCCQVYDLASRTRRINFVQRINPQRSITASAQAIHGISSADLIGCPLWEEVGPKVRLIIERCGLIVWHNGHEFDRKFLDAELERIGQKKITTPDFDTMLEARWATPVGAVPSLQALCFACDVPYDVDEAHAADYDVTVMMECFFRGLDWGFFRLPEAIAERVAA